jgi:hypothetical protein
MRLATYVMIAAKSETFENFTAWKAAYAQEKLASLKGRPNSVLRHRSGWASL